VTYVDVTRAEVVENLARPGDFFVLRGNGNREQVGTGGVLVVEPPEDCIFSDKLIRLRFDPAEVAEGFMHWLWQSRAFLHRLQAKAESGSGLWMMSKRDISRELFACPPMDEQRLIVQLLAAMQAHEEAVRQRVEALRRLAFALRGSTLTGSVRLGPIAEAVGV